jgi:aldose 1-epimerase
VTFQVVAACIVAAIAAPVSAQLYSARRTGDVVQLEDAKTQTVISIVPAVGNVVFEMKVKGQNVLRWPYGSVEEFKTRPALSGIPFLGPWANRLDQQAFYANGGGHGGEEENPVPSPLAPREPQGRHEQRRRATQLGMS